MWYHFKGHKKREIKTLFLYLNRKFVSIINTLTQKQHSIDSRTKMEIKT